MKVGLKLGLNEHGSTIDTLLRPERLLDKVAKF